MEERIEGGGTFMGCCSSGEETEKVGEQVLPLLSVLFIGLGQISLATKGRTTKKGQKG